MNWPLLHYVLLTPEAITFHSGDFPPPPSFCLFPPFFLSTSLCLWLLSLQISLLLFFLSLTFSHLPLPSPSPLSLCPSAPPFSPQNLGEPWSHSLTFPSIWRGQSGIFLLVSGFFLSVLWHPGSEVSLPHRDSYLLSRDGGGDPFYQRHHEGRATRERGEASTRRQKNFIARNGWQDLFYWPSGPGLPWHPLGLLGILRKSNSCFLVWEMGQQRESGPKIIY